MASIWSVVHHWKESYKQPEGRTGELWSSTLHEIQYRTDRLFYHLLLTQYAAAVILALVYSPLAWSGSTSSVHFHVWLAVVFGGLLTSLPLYLIRVRPAAVLTRHAVAVAQMLFGAMLIHLTGGRIETHFHVFGSLAFLAFYRDIPVLCTATAVVATDHFLRGVFIPESVYGVISGANWRFLEHAFWVVFENGFLALSCIQSRAQMAATASQQAELEAVNERIEEAVQNRTRELALRTDELAAARDAAMESARLKSQFLANVSHEIRTPMNGVLGMTALLLDTSLTPEQQDYAVTVQRSAEGLLSVINDILDFSKIEAGKLVLERVDFLLWKEIEDVVNLLSAAADQKQLELVCDIDPATPVLVTGDAGRLRQILVNLTGNAVKFTTDGEVIVRVSQAEPAGSTSRVRFEIADTGMGIADTARKNLFQAFVQADGSTTRKHEGTGLGLAISRELVQLMGGEIGFESTPGAGSTFWFEIPFHIVLASHPDRPLQWTALRGLRLLIVDDNATNRKVMLRIFEAMEITAESVADAQTAIDIMQTRLRSGTPFDVVLLDLQMPEMDGIQLARAIRQQVGLEHTPLLLLTSLGQRALCKSLVDAGISACIVKPVRRDHLLLMIARLCGRAVISNAGQGETHSRRSVPPSRRMSVLIAEDNLVNQRILTSIVQRLGHECVVVNDGEEAVEAVKQARYDVVLMDCQMPRVDGFEAAAAIRRLSHAAARVPIIAVTANAMSGDRERCLSAGMTGYIAKPFRYDDVAEALRSIPHNNRVLAEVESASASAAGI